MEITKASVSKVILKPGNPCRLLQLEICYDLENVQDLRDTNEQEEKLAQEIGKAIATVVFDKVEWSEEPNAHSEPFGGKQVDEKEFGWYRIV